jgi:hypothetical protein
MIGRVQSLVLHPCYQLKFVRTVKAPQESVNGLLKRAFIILVVWVVKNLQSNDRTISLIASPDIF